MSARDSDDRIPFPLRLLSPVIELLCGLALRTIPKDRRHQS